MPPKTAAYWRGALAAARWFAVSAGRSLLHLVMVTVTGALLL
jgi:hypothetical protein